MGPARIFLVDPLAARAIRVGLETRSPTMTKTDASALDVVRYRITGMDCGDCAAKIEKAVGKLPGVEEARVSIAK